MKDTTKHDLMERCHAMRNKAAILQDELDSAFPDTDDILLYTHDLICMLTTIQHDVFKADPRSHVQKNDTKAVHDLTRHFVTALQRNPRPPEGEATICWHQPKEEHSFIDLSELGRALQEAGVNMH